LSRFITQIETCIPALRRYANALAYNSHDAEELVQDTLERALRKRRLWKPTSSVRAWLFTILHNLHANHVRKLSRQPGFSPLDDNLEKTNSPIDSTLQINTIERAIRQLPDDQQYIILLVALEGLKYKEVSNILGIPEGTVMSRLSRAREALRNILSEENQPKLRRIK